MKIIKTKIFAKWADKNKVSEQSLVIAANEIALELNEANYGGGLLKKRVANKGRGKSSSTRTIVAFKKGNNCFFIYGFKKMKKAISLQARKKLLKLSLNIY